MDYGRMCRTCLVKPVVRKGYCRNCWNKYCREQRAKLPESRRKYYNRNQYIRQIKYRYNLSEERYKELMESQNNACAVCKTTSERLVVDHDHATGEVRGLLCDRCNIVVEHMVKNPDWSTKAIAYLERFSDE